MTGTTCVGDEIGSFAQGLTTESILEELSEQFCGCTHITGSIQIDLSTTEDNPLNLTEDNFNFLYHIEEISGVLRFQNFSAVPRIVLPNLVIIRGEEQVPTSEGHRLVLIVRNTEIGELIMPQLREISDGDVLFENTGDLCNYRTVNWLDILNVGELVEVNACDFNSGASVFPDCSGCSPDPHCWSTGLQYCQTLSRLPCMECGLDRCYRVGGNTLQCCNPQCAAGCFGSRQDQCFACKQFDNNGTCVTQCPPEVVYDPDLFQVVPNPDFRLAAGDLCVEECPEGLFELSGTCLLRCPTDFFSNEQDECIRCNGPCPRECPGLTIGQNVDASTIEQFRDCTIVASGGLYISIAPSTFNHDNLELLSTIQEIRGPLRIQGWDGESFPYLRNLRVVGDNATTLTLQCSMVVSDFSLLIAANAALTEIDLSSLEEIRAGGYLWFNNNQLCFTGNYSNYLVDLAEMQCVNSPRRDGEACIADGFTCHEQCASEFSCWGRNDTQCDGCLNFEYRDRCVQNCSSVELASDTSGLFQNETRKMCEECNQQCLLGCTNGVGPENCVDCRNNFINLANGRLCVEVCPLGTYLIPSTRECAPCFEACVGSCTGPLPYVNISQGCLECSRVELDRNGQQVACLRTGCAVGTYLDFLVDSIGDLPSGSEVCRPCDELCAACFGPGTTELICPACMFAARIDEGCIRECDNLTEYFQSTTRFCLPCHPACDGCVGSTSSNCIQCANNFVKEFLDMDRTSFICQEECSLNKYISPENVCEDCDALFQQCLGRESANCTSCCNLLASFSCSCPSSCEEAPAAVSPAVFGGTVAAVVAIALVLVLVTVLVVKQRRKTVTVTGGGQQEDTIAIKPNPVYGVSLEQTSPQQYRGETEGMGPHSCHDYDYVGGGRQQDTIEIKPNPVYGVSLQLTPPQSPGETEYYINEGMGPDSCELNYDYVK